MLSSGISSVTLIMTRYLALQLLGGTMSFAFGISALSKKQKDPRSGPYI